MTLIWVGIFWGYYKESVVPWLRSSANKVQTNVFCCCLIVNYGVALHRTCYTIVCTVSCARHGIFWGVNFWSKIFLGFAGSPRDFFGSWLLAPFDHPRHLKSRVPPPTWGIEALNPCLGCLGHDDQQALACSRLRDGGGKSFSNKKCDKRAFFPPPPPPFPSRARLIFAFLVLIRSHYTIWEPGTG